jgi:hypothetical protein
MKHLLNGVAIAAALAIAAPAWAQAPMTPSAAPKSAPAAAPAAAAPAPMASKQRHKRTKPGWGNRAARRGGARMAPGDAMTEQLNREELARLQGGGAPPPAPPPAQQGPRAGVGQH